MMQVTSTQASGSASQNAANADKKTSNGQLFGDMFAEMSEPTEKTGATSATKTAELSEQQRSLDKDPGEEESTDGKEGVTDEDKVSQNLTEDGGSEQENSEAELTVQVTNNEQTTPVIASGMASEQAVTDSNKQSVEEEESDKAQGVLDKHSEFLRHIDKSNETSTELKEAEQQSTVTEKEVSEESREEASVNSDKPLTGLQSSEKLPMEAQVNSEKQPETKVQEKTTLSQAITSISNGNSEASSQQNETESDPQQAAKQVNILGVKEKEAGDNKVELKEAINIRQNPLVQGEQAKPELDITHAVEAPTKSGSVESPIPVTTGAFSSPIRGLEQSGIQVNQQVSQQVTEQQLLQQKFELAAKEAPSMLRERITLMMNQGIQQVEIRLDPAELGSMYIKLQMQNDQLSVSIQVQQPQSRELLEQNMPKLREMLAEQGIQLGESAIEQQQQGQTAQKDQQAETEQNMGGDEASDEGLAQNITMGRLNFNQTEKGIDFYA